MNRRSCAKLAVALCCASGLVHAQANVPTRPVLVQWAQLPSVSFSARDFVDRAVEKKLTSGLPQTLTVRLYAYDEHGKQPLAVSALSCRVVYDLWENVYRIERQSERVDQALSSPNLDGVVRSCVEARARPVGDAATFAGSRGRRIYFGVLIELNPLSQDTVQRIRRWLARPSGNQLEGNAFFGSFVSIFVSRQMGSAEKSLAFRSPFVRVP